MGDAAPEVQWTLNTALAEIGINFAKHLKRAIVIGETLGVYHDYPCSKGCTSLFAPIWINEMVSRQGCRCCPKHMSRTTRAMNISRSSPARSCRDEELSVQ